MSKDALCITGYGLATALGCNAVTFMKNLTEGRTRFQRHRQIKTMDHWDPIVAYVDDESLAEGVDPRTLRKLDRFSLMAIQAFRGAQTTASLKSQEICPFGLLIGNSTGGWAFVEPQMRDIYQGDYDSLSPYVATAWFPTAPQGEISIQNKLSGYSKTFAADALSSGYAMEHALYLIRNGYLPGAFVGGVEAPLSTLVYNSCIRSEPISPSGAYLPFHEQSNGYLLGEGSGFLAVESLDHVQGRQGAPLASILGLGLGSTLSEAIQACLDDAKKSPGEIDCIFLDAKSTPHHDAEEYAALEKCFHSCSNISLTTTKTLHGSLLAADFIVQLVVAVMALVEQKIPRGLYSKNNHKRPSFGQLIVDTPLDQKLDTVLVYARNLDGSSISILLDRSVTGLMK